MAESTVVSCPSCGKKYKISADKLGRTFKCTGCETRFKAGEELAPPPPAAATPPPMVQTQTAPPSFDDEAESGGQAAAPAAVNYSDSTTGKPKTSGLAITSLVCGLLGCIPGAQILAVIFGFLSLGKIKKGLAGGKGLAITGIILGVLGIISYGVGGVLGYQLYTKGKGVVQQAVVVINMQRIYRSISQYQGNNQQHFPADLSVVWKNDSLLDGKVFVSPFTTDTPAATPAQLESGGHDSYKYIYPGADATVSASTDLLLYEKTPEPGTDQITLLFGDGHVTTCKPAELAGFINRTGKVVHPAK